MDLEISSDMEPDAPNLIFSEVKAEYEQIRTQMYKEMEIEKVQNKIYKKIYGQKKTNNFIFKRIDNPDEFKLKNEEEFVSEESSKEETIESDESDIVDFNKIEDDEENLEVYKNKFLDLEAEEGSSIEEVEMEKEDFDFNKDLRKHEEMIKKFEMKYLKKKKKDRSKFEIEDCKSSSEDELHFEQFSENEEPMTFEKDEESVECVETEIKKDFL